MAYSTTAWYEDCYISVSHVGGSETELCTKTTNISISGGDFDIEGIDTFCGKVTRVGTKEDIEIALDGIPVSNRDFDWIFHGTSVTGNTITSSTATKTRVTFLWTNQTGVTAATQAITTASEAYRRMYAEAYCTGLEYNMDAGEHLTITTNFKLAFEDSDGEMNFKIEACDTSSALTASSAYTTSNKF